jgi:hypothetical protein
MSLTLFGKFGERDYYYIRVGFIMFYATFNNISVISWRSVLLVEYPENTTDLPLVTDKLYYIILHLAMSGIRNLNISGDRQ